MRPEPWHNYLNDRLRSLEEIATPDGFDRGARLCRRPNRISANQELVIEPFNVNSVQTQSLVDQVRHLRRMPLLSDMSLAEGTFGNAKVGLEGYSTMT